MRATSLSPLSLLLFYISASAVRASPTSRIKRDCAVPCGYDSQVCCSAGQACATNSLTQAVCVAGGNGPSAAVLAPGYTTTVVQISTVIQTTAPQTTANCNFALNQSPCGSSCCVGGQTCSNGQCVVLPGGNSGGTYSSLYIAPTTTGPGTDTFSAPLRPTTVTSGSTTVIGTTRTTSTTATRTTSRGTTSAVPFETPTGTAGGIIYGVTAGGSGKLSGGAIAGIVFGVLIGIALLILLCICCCARALWDDLLIALGLKRRHGSDVSSSTEHSGSHHGGFLKWAAIAGILASLFAIFRKKKEEEKSNYSYSSYTGTYSDYTTTTDSRTRTSRTSTSSASSDDRRTGYTRSTRR